MVKEKDPSTHPPQHLQAHTNFPLSFSSEKWSEGLRLNSLLLAVVLLYRAYQSPNIRHGNMFLATKRSDGLQGGMFAELQPFSTARGARRENVISPESTSGPSPILEI